MVNLHDVDLSTHSDLVIVGSGRRGTSLILYGLEVGFSVQESRLIFYMTALCDEVLGLAGRVQSVRLTTPPGGRDRR